MAKESTAGRRGWWRWLAAKWRRDPPALGARGEAHAARFLKRQGMRIIARNRRKGKGEIDLIAIDGQWIVFVEVRTRTSEDFMTPERSVRYRKRMVVARTVRQLMRRHRRTGYQARIDLVAIIWPEGAKEPATVRHHKGAIAIARW